MSKPVMIITYNVGVKEKGRPIKWLIAFDWRGKSEHALASEGGKRATYTQVGEAIATLKNIAREEGYTDYDIAIHRTLESTYILGKNRG